MNIAAWRAACDVWDLDRTAKHTLQVICGHVARPPAMAVKVPIRRIAFDMGVHYNTAYRAVRRLADAGYLAVENQGRGHVSVIRLNLDRLRLTFTPEGKTGFTSEGETTPSTRGKTLLPPTVKLEDELDKNRRGVRAASPNGPAHAQGNGAVSAQTAPAHPDDCACAGTGWIDHHAGVVRCPAF